MLRIFIGYDPRQVISYTALQQSIFERSSKPVSITPLVLSTLPITRRGLTPFTFSRFLCPWLCDYKGLSLFLDADMIVMGDIAELFSLMDDDASLMVVKNKMKFEWGSMMLFNNEKCQVLTPQYIEKDGNPLTLEWAEKIGDLPAEWNHCVGYDEPRESPKLIHYTQGVPAWPETKNSEHADLWFAELKKTMHREPWADLMGSSVHAKAVYDRLANEKAA